MRWPKQFIHKYHRNYIYTWDTKYRNYTLPDGTSFTKKYIMSYEKEFKEQTTVFEECVNEWNNEIKDIINEI